MTSAAQRRGPLVHRRRADYAAAMPEFVQLAPGDSAPWFKARSPSNPQYVFNTAGGRWIVLAFIGSAGGPKGAAMWAAAQSMRPLFDDTRIAFFGVTMDPKDESEPRVAQSMPGMRWFWDLEGAISKLYGAAPRDWVVGKSKVDYRPQWILLDPTLRVAAVWDGENVEGLRRSLETLPEVNLAAGVELQAPILYLPRIFEPALCSALIDAYEQAGGQTSGFMVERDGKTHLQYDDGHKKRRDHLLDDDKLIAATRERIRRRIVNEVKKVHQFEVTRMERFLVGCYTAEEGGHFRPHRDNTTPGTAHRRFAMSVNLNADFEGGQLGFPEYGSRTFKPPPGGAVVFSCSLLHTVTPVTKGRRYAFLPFLYDEAAAKIREANNASLAEGVKSYNPNAGEQRARA